MESLWKFLLLLVFGPALLLVALQVWAAVLAVVLPVLIVLALIAGVAAGLSAAFVLRKRLPPRNGGTPLPPGTPPLGPYRVRRPRGGKVWR